MVLARDWILEYVSHARGYKLDPTLINVLVERWWLEIHTFHLSRGEFAITLKEIALQIGLPMDGLAITGLVIVLGKVDFYRAMLGKVPNTFDGGGHRTIHLSIHYKVNRGILMPNKS
ncbi:hypothetical protein PVK06_002248 [Gossypium arboreum]|uniref:Aminotransferase-like plant mobile domain-containing protein n=1 Tax=Gossypium arboreum TaxID=29729 RepID=A0ABR0R325_GOSAR|nr:hypothetical protein PVK06_002248 [Gossypium arboreum]